MPEHEVTLGEVYRLVVAVQKDLREFQRELVGRKEYQSDQTGIDRRFAGLTTELAEIKSDLASADARLEAETGEITRRLDETDKEQRRNRQSWTLSLVGIGATAILGPIATILIQGST